MSNYIYAEEGNEKSDIKVISEKGIVKFFPKHIAEDAKLMSDAGYSIVEAPLKITAKEKTKEIDKK